MKQIFTRFGMFAAACAFALNVAAEKAPVYINTDMTKQFESLTIKDNWTFPQTAGNSGYTAESFCPKVTTNSGLSVQVIEHYMWATDQTGDIFYSTVKGLASGTYKIELYGGAAFTFGRGFTSEAFCENGEDNNQHLDAGYKIEENTGVTLYAETSEGSYGGEIPIYYATNFPEGAATVELNGVVVGSNGEIKIGMSKTSRSTNWHIIQLKGVSAQVNAVELYATLKAQAEAINTEGVPEAAVAALQAAMVDDTDFTTAEQYQEALANLQAAMDAVNACVVAKPMLEKMAAYLETTNFYTAEALNAYYTSIAEKYEAGTLTLAEANTLQDPNAVLAWHADNRVDDLLLSVWTIGGEQANAYDKALYINTWSTENALASNGMSDIKVPFFEYWVDDKLVLGANEMEATLTGLTPNAKYMVTGMFRVRQTNDLEKVDGSITLQVGDGEAVDVTQGLELGTSKRFQNEYSATGMADADGKLVVKVTVAEGSNVSWLAFRDLKYAELVPATADDYAALATAIEENEGKALGFEAEEYAPYNNVEALVALAAAKAIDPTVENMQEDVLALNHALTAAVWTANTEEVNAIYDGTLRNAPIQATSENVVLPGWTTQSGNTRQTFKGTDENGKACLADAIDQVGLFVHPGTYVYGLQTGYTMPLKENTVYTVEAKYCAWQGTSNNDFTLSVYDSEYELAYKSYGPATGDCTQEGALKAVKLTFRSSLADNCLLYVGANGNTFMTDFILKKASEADKNFFEAKEELQKNIKVAEAMEREDMAEAIAEAKAALEAEDATLESITAANQALLAAINEATGIQTVETKSVKSEAVYNIAGQRVVNAQKGLFIVNGKKVVK